MGIPINPPGKYLGSQTKNPITFDRFEEFFTLQKVVTALYDDVFFRVGFGRQSKNLIRTKRFLTPFFVYLQEGGDFFWVFFAAELHIVIQAIAHLDTSRRILTLVKLSRTQRYATRKLLPPR